MRRMTSRLTMPANYSMCMGISVAVRTLPAPASKVLILMTRDVPLEMLVVVLVNPNTIPEDSSPIVNRVIRRCPIEATAIYRGILGIRGVYWIIKGGLSLMDRMIRIIRVIAGRGAKILGGSLRVLDINWLTWATSLNTNLRGEGRLSMYTASSPTMIDPRFLRIDPKQSKSPQKSPNNR